MKTKITKKAKKAKNPKAVKKTQVKKPFFLPPHKPISVISQLSQTQCWSIKQTNIPETWKITKGDGIRIAVIDTGWTNHIDIGDNAVKGKCCVKGESLDDLEGHSTHVTGIICAKDNDVGMVGVAPLAQVINVKALDKHGMGTLDSIIEALNYCAEIKPDIVSMSLGCLDSSDALYQAIKKVYDLNIPIICAAGNNGSVGGVNYPAKWHPECIAVAAFDDKNNIADFSAEGSEVDWAAPGVDIYSTFLGNRYCIMSGTSMACPYFAGLVALLLAKHRKQELETGNNDCKTVAQIREHLLKYTTPEGFVGKDNHWGYGIVDPVRLIMEQSLVPPNPVQPKHNTSFWSRVKHLLFSIFG